MSTELEKGVLYVVPTPIGNLSDITERAKDVLKESDFVAAEDTRVSGKLLFLLDIKKPMVSYHEHNKASTGKAICEKIKSGLTCALVTDAGTPAISDPGADLVALCHEEGIKVVALPGPCAAVTALSGSGMLSRRFCFEGFLPDNKKERKEYLDSISNEKRTLIYYIAPDDLEKTIVELFESLGERRCVLAKELTKLNERYIPCTLSSLPDFFKTGDPALKKGEFVLIVEGSVMDSKPDWEELTITEHITRYMQLGLSKMDACKKVARDRGVPKSEIYKTATDMATELISDLKGNEQ